MLNLEFSKDPVIKINTDEIKDIDQKSTNYNLESSDLIKTRIMNIAQRFETLIIDSGNSGFVNTVCSLVVTHFENNNLEHHIKYVYKILPDEYKDTTKQQYKQQQSKLYLKMVNKQLDELQTSGFGKLSNDDFLTVYKKCVGLTDLLSDEIDLRGIQTDTGEDNNQLESLKDVEKHRFIKAEIGQPLETIQTMIDKEGVTYEQAFNEMDKSFRQMITTAEKMHDWFCKQYVPLSAAACVKAKTAIDYWNDFFRPFIDKKFRRDHYQLLEIALTKISETSTKASRLSRIASGHHKDPKTGLPIFRSMTKEQIDSIYPDEINFMLNMFNWLFWSYKDLSEVNKEHGARNKEDRAIDLSPHLSHDA